MNPTGDHVREFSRRIFTEHVLISNPRNTINLQTEFRDFLRSQGAANVTSEEFSERNINWLIELVFERCEEWHNLGMNSPLHLLDQAGRIITWPHPKFTEISGKVPISSRYCDLLASIRSATERRFLGYAACYLYALGCDKIFITDTSGDGGVDLIGSFVRGNLGDICVFVQAKTTQGGSRLGKDSLLSDFSKYLLLRRLPKWIEYCDAIDASPALSGRAPIYLFISNSEFKPALQEAASGLDVLLRSGRQIASVLVQLTDAQTLDLAVSSLEPFEVNIRRNLYTHLKTHL